MDYTKTTCCSVIVLVITLSCSNSLTNNNEQVVSDSSEEKPHEQQSQHVNVDRRSSATLCDCYDRSHGCFRYGKSECTGDLYKGSRSYTAHGTKCQDWSSDKPHKHDYNSLPRNYCRNPSGDKGPWCYTMNPVKRWDYCFSDCAANDCFDDKRKCFHYGKARCSEQYMYNGTRSYTIDGIKCQEWSSNKPKSHKYNYLPKDYCRNPDGEDGPWCYSTKPIKEVTGVIKARNWDYCLADCAVDSCYDPSRPHPCFHRQKKGCRKPYVYNGTVNFNLDRNIHKKVCMKWSLVGYSHLPENYCRNPDNGEGPWCYTKKIEKTWKWNYCFVDCGDCWANCYSTTVGTVEPGMPGIPSRMCEKLAELKTCAIKRCQPDGEAKWKAYIQTYKRNSPRSCPHVN